MEENLEGILEKINTSVEERVNAAIETGIVRIAQQYRQVNQAKTTATTDLKAQVSDIKSTVAQLRANSALYPTTSVLATETLQTPTPAKLSHTGTGRKYPKKRESLGKPGYYGTITGAETKKANYRIAYKRSEQDGYKAWNKA